MLWLSAAEGLSAQTASLNVEDLPLKEVLSELESTSGYIFIYKDGSIDAGRRVTVAVSDAPIEEILAAILGDGIGYVINGRQISLFRKPPVKPLEPQEQRQVPASPPA